MTTPFFHIPSTNSSTTSSTTTTTTIPLSNPNSSSNSKPRGRKHGGKSQNGPKNKIRQRGVGIAELERIREKNNSPPLPHLHPHDHPNHHHHHVTNTTTNSSINATNIRPFFSPRVNHSNPLSGVPVIRYCIPGQPIPDPRLTNRVSIPGPSSSSPAFASELPSMPNPYPLDFSTLSFKKKKMIGEETSTVGFSKGYNSNFGGFDLKNGDNDYLPFNGGFSAHATTTTNTATSEVVAIHRKWNGSENVMMEYGFFPGKSSDSEENMNNNFQDYNYYNKIMEDELNLKMGLISDSSSSPSSSSSLSSLTTATTTTTSNTSVDLSLKLSYH
ncbi:hypothetical protein BVRB_4g093380 [Beta vulgaris subsp. vulgaris]|uniref:Uncharacterized protein n=1 Tax=Beta vulgaris subsp. vulgaris TaxID=3555 RepID=A0A0J8BBU5_BETVV|nr:uncharacterized protein LOC104907268 [Beta vulgaris subsp. vulgaris]KMS98386.1 hypothetical protein BVRB_4g093380 [Beta vulgaris subsp. vulgaris]